jgi:hypothetical protein
MTQYKIIIAFLLTMSFGQAFSQTEMNDHNVRIKVPTDWIEKLRRYDYSGDNTSLLKQFESIIKPDTLPCSFAYSHDNGGIFSPMFVNLDEDLIEELTLLLGWSENDPSLAVFKKIEGSWYMIYFEPFYMFYRPPELQVANCFSANKTFYIRQLYDRGLGIYCDAYQFYKVINNKVYPCLTLINEAHIMGWGLYMNQTVKLKFEFNSTGHDELSVAYDYNFFPGTVYGHDTIADDERDIFFVKGDNETSYIWDTLTYTYKPVIGESDSSEYLTGEKIACFGDFGDDSLFVKAFKYEIAQTLDNGIAGQKRLLQKYLNIVKTDHSGFAPEATLEEKAWIGGLRFFGPKEKKE